MGSAATPDPDLAAVLHVMREERGITREELASRCGISTHLLTRIELAEVMPTWETVCRLVREFGVGLGEVTGARGATVAPGLDSAAHLGGRRRRKLGAGGIHRR